MQRLAKLIIMVGIILALYPAFTNVFAAYQQERLRVSLGAFEEDSATQPWGDVSLDEDPALSGPSHLDPAANGEFAGAVLTIPVLDLSAVVMGGTAPAELKIGPGWYPESALPGEGNTAIAGHRTMYGAWFRHLDRLQAGDVIKLDYQGRTYRYLVEKVYVVAKNDWSVIAPTVQAVLTLTTCHPVGSARQRLVVRALLAE